MYIKLLEIPILQSLSLYYLRKHILSFLSFAFHNYATTIRPIQFETWNRIETRALWSSLIKPQSWATLCIIVIINIARYSVSAKDTRSFVAIYLRCGSAPTFLLTFRWPEKRKGSLADRHIWIEGRNLLFGTRGEIETINTRMRADIVHFRGLKGTRRHWRRTRVTFKCMLGRQMYDSILDGLVETWKKKKKRKKNSNYARAWLCVLLSGIALNFVIFHTSAFTIRRAIVA